MEVGGAVEMRVHPPSTCRVQPPLGRVRACRLGQSGKPKEEAGGKQPRHQVN